MNLRSNEEFLFTPPRRARRLVNLGWIFVLLASAALGLYSASRAQVGLVFLLWLLTALLAVILIPVLAYQLYSLQTAYYILERDGLRLRWGLRYVDIPMTAVTWVRSQAELNAPLPLPALRIPGAVVGVRQLPPQARQAGPTTIEYLASEARSLVLIGTESRIYAISIENTADFLFTYQRLAELGSLTPLAPRSVLPSFLLARVWAARPARFLILTSLVLSLALLVWVALAVSGRAQVHLGFLPDGSPGDQTPAVQLLLIPVLNSLVILVDLLAGMFFFRREETQELSYLLWGFGAFIPTLFMLGTFFILRAG